MNEERSSPGSKKKFLYLDKFNDHVTKDTEWKKKAEFAILNTKKLLILVTLVFGILIITVLAVCIK